MQTEAQNQIVRFGSFEIDLREHKLTKMGVRIRLQEQPFRILVLLLQRSGELVTREEIRKKLWPQDVHVDFDASLNTAVRKLREALSDSADNPRFLQTVSGRGYRFVAPVAWPQEDERIAPNVSPVYWFRYLWLTIVLIVFAVGLLATYWHLRRPTTHISADDTIILIDFANTTGDSVFDGTLKTALSLSLRQSPFFKVAPDSTVARTLQQMVHPADTKLTPDLRRELCQRAHGKAYLTGSIAGLDSKYLLELTAVNCQNGDTLVQEQAIARSKNKVLDALGEMTLRLRGELGESLPSLQKYDVTLANATTSSLDALKTLSIGLKVFTEKGPAASLSYFRRVVELDPNFAIGYRSLGLSYFSMGEPDEASVYFSKAFQLRNHLTEWEKLAITADYYLNVTGELDKAADTYEQWIASYPRNDGAYSTLGIVYALQGDYEKAIEITNRALRLAPSYGSYLNLAYYDLAMQRFEEARQVVSEANARKFDGAHFHYVLYALAFHDGNSALMAEQQHWFVGKTEETYGLALAGDTEAHRGHLGKAQALTREAVDSAIRTGNNETGAIWLANTAVAQAAYGKSADARKSAANALKLAPKSRGVQAEAALAMAMAGDIQRAESLAEDIRKRFPLDSQVQSLWEPVIQTQLSLERKSSRDVLKAVPFVTQIEFGTIPFDTNLSCLYPAYIRGEAYLAAGQARSAVGEFQKILDHSGIVWNCWTGALAHLGVARAYSMEARTTTDTAESGTARNRALAAYQDFLTLWKDADSDIPIYKQAKAEYAKMQ